MMEAIPSSETFVLSRATLRHTTEDDILHIHRRGNLKSDRLKNLRKVGWIDEWVDWCIASSIMECCAWTDRMIDA
jgi:hypothetical protein